MLKYLVYLFLILLSFTMLTYMSKNTAEPAPKTEEKFSSQDELSKSIAQLEQEVAAVADTIKNIKNKLKGTNVATFANNDDAKEPKEKAKPEKLENHTPKKAKKKCKDKEDCDEEFVGAESDNESDVSDYKPKKTKRFEGFENYGGVSSKMVDHFMLL